MSTEKVAPLREIRQRALRGGIAGSTAQVMNVFSLMWLRTTMNYQYRHGGTAAAAIGRLWMEGGIPRFYRGLVPALIHSPLTRFGDTAANVGALSALEAFDQTATLPIGLKTAIASSCAASWRLALMPIDAWKTIKQVEGKHGVTLLMHKVNQEGIARLYHGSVAAMTATWVGHYPWFLTHNLLDKHLMSFDFPHGRVARNAFLGFCSAVVSDTCSNSIRVLKTSKQTAQVPTTYRGAAASIIRKDGVLGLFGRGLKTRIATNAIQGMVFSVGWKGLEEYLHKRSVQRKTSSST